MITTISLVTSQSYCFFPLMRNFRSTFLATSKYTVLSTMVIMLHITFPELTYDWKFVRLDTFIPLSSFEEFPIMPITQSWWETAPQLQFLPISSAGQATRQKFCSQKAQFTFFLHSLTLEKNSQNKHYLICSQKWLMLSLGYVHCEKFTWKYLWMDENIDSHHIINSLI